MKRFAILYFLTISLSSCGTYRINKTSDFGKINDLSELNGTYSDGKLRQRTPRLMAFFNYEAETDSVTINFPNDTTLLVSYYEYGILKTEEIIGKRKKNYFEVYYSKEQFFIPLIYSRISVDRIRIGRYKNTNDLLIRNFIDQTGNILIIAGGYSREKPYIYERIN